MTTLLTKFSDSELELFTPRFDRTIERGCLVGVHWNKHQEVWSIVAMKSRKSIGLVVGYADEITLKNVTFHIEKSKQAKVRELGSKDRHAFVVGEIVSFTATALQGVEELYYNPFKVDTFVDKANGIVMESVEAVSMTFDQKPVVKYGAIDSLGL